MRSSFRTLRFVIAFALTLAPAIAPSHTQAASQGADLAALKRFNPTFLRTWADSGSVDNKTGAAGKNRRTFLTVEFQRVSSRSIAAGLALHNASDVNTGFRVINYTLAHLQPDGRFAYVSAGRSRAESRPNAAWVEAGPAGFFLQDLGESLILLDESNWFQRDSAFAAARSSLPVVDDRDNAAMTWLLSKQENLHADPSPNRELAYGDAFYLNGLHLHRNDAIRAGKALIEEALAGQRPDGTFAELGRFDSSYQAVSLYMLELAFLHTDFHDAGFRNELWHALQIGMDRETSSLTPSGMIVTQGNSRVTGVMANGKQHIDRLSVNLAFQYYAAITGDPAYVRDADAVYNYYATH